MALKLSPLAAHPMKRARWIAITLLLVTMTGLEFTRRSVPVPIRAFRAHKHLFECCLQRGLGETGQPTIELAGPSESARQMLANLGFRKIVHDPRGFVRFYYANHPFDPVVEIICCPSGYGLLQQTYLTEVNELQVWQRIDQDYYYCEWEFN